MTPAPDGRRRARIATGPNYPITDTSSSAATMPIATFFSMKYPERHEIGTTQLRSRGEVIGTLLSASRERRILLARVSYPQNMRPSSGFQFRSGTAVAIPPLRKALKMRNIPNTFAANKSLYRSRSQYEDTWAHALQGRLCQRCSAEFRRFWRAFRPDFALLPHHQLQERNLDGSMQQCASGSRSAVMPRGDAGVRQRLLLAERRLRAARQSPSSARCHLRPLIVPNQHFVCCRSHLSSTAASHWIICVDRRRLLRRNRK